MPLQPSIAQTRSGHRRSVLEHRPVAGDIGAEPAATDHGLIGGHDLDGHRPLVRVHPDHDPLCLSLHALLPTLDPDVVVEPGGHRYFELSKPLLSLSLPWVGTRVTQAK